MDATFYIIIILLGFIAVICVLLVGLYFVFRLIEAKRVPVIDYDNNVVAYARAIFKKDRVVLKYRKYIFFKTIVLPYQNFDYNKIYVKEKDKVSVVDKNTLQSSPVPLTFIRKMMDTKLASALTSRATSVDYILYFALGLLTGIIIAFVILNYLPPTAIKPTNATTITNSTTYITKSITPIP